MNRNEIKDFISKELLKFEFKRYSKGYKYLKEAILLCIEKEDAIDNLRKNVLYNLAVKYNEKSYLNVKWCIEQSLKTMFNNTDMKLISKYFNLEENLRPSLKFFIYTIVCNYFNKNNYNY